MRFAVCPHCGYVLPMEGELAAFGGERLSIQELGEMEPCRSRRVVVLACEDPPYAPGDPDAQRAWMDGMHARARSIEAGMN